jgi:iron complex transport system ATP-binding protein
LKTGRVDHEVFQKKSIRITGHGHEYLWTKNALERNGYAINHEADMEVVIKGTPPLWVLLGNREFTTLFDLLAALNKL